MRSTAKKQHGATVFGQWGGSSVSWVAFCPANHAMGKGFPGEATCSIQDDIPNSPSMVCYSASQ